jgi:hypothetical protein
MPTPESAAFLAQKPKVPPTFDGVDYSDNAALKAAQDAVIREQWVKSMMVRLVRDELGKCYWREGVNHFEKCAELRGEFGSDIQVEGVDPRGAEGLKQDEGWFEATEKYLDMMKHSRVRGYLWEQQNYVPKEE